MCFAGSIRDIFLMKNFDLFTGNRELFGVMLIYNVATGNFALSFTGNPVDIHNICGNRRNVHRRICGNTGRRMSFKTTCFGRTRVILNAAVTVAGLFVGAALCHNLKLASAAAAPATKEAATVIGKVYQREKWRQLSVSCCYLPLHL